MYLLLLFYYLLLLLLSHNSFRSTNGSLGSTHVVCWHSLLWYISECMQLLGAWVHILWNIGVAYATVPQRLKSDRLNTENNLQTLTSSQQINCFLSAFVSVSAGLSNSLLVLSVFLQYMHFLTVIWVASASNPHPLGFRFL